MCWCSFRHHEWKTTQPKEMLFHRVRSVYVIGCVGDSRRHAMQTFLQQLSFVVSSSESKTEKNYKKKIFSSIQFSLLFLVGHHFRSHSSLKCLIAFFHRWTFRHSFYFDHSQVLFNDSNQIEFIHECENEWETHATRHVIENWNENRKKIALFERNKLKRAKRERERENEKTLSSRNIPQCVCESIQKMFYSF